MKRYLYLFPLMAFTAATLALSACDDNKAEDTAAADQTMTAPETTTADAMVAPSAATVTAMDGKSFATAPGVTVGGVFVTLQNSGTETDKLVGATTDVAPTVEIHETSMDSATGTMQMRKVDSVEIGAGQQATLSPEGYHIMLMGLTAPLTEGQTFNVTLDFDKSADVVVPVTVTAAGAPAAAMTPPEAMTTSPDAAMEMMTPPSDASTPTETTPDASVAPTTDVPTGAASGTMETPATEDTQEEPTTAQ